MAINLKAIFGTVSLMLVPMTVAAENIELTFNSKMMVYTTEDATSVNRRHFPINEVARYMGLQDKRVRGQRTFGASYHESRITGGVSLAKNRYNNQKTLTINAAWEPKPQLQCHVNQTFAITMLPAKFDVVLPNGCSFYAVVSNASGLTPAPVITPRKPRSKELN